MSQKYHTLHKRFTPQANTKHHKQCFRIQMPTGHLIRLSIPHNCTWHDKRTVSWRNGACLAEIHEISCLHFKYYSNDKNTTSSGCVTTLTAVVGRRQNYRQRSRDRLTTSLRERKKGGDAQRRDTSATDLWSSSILQYEQHDQTVDLMLIANLTCSLRRETEVSVITLLWAFTN